MIQVEISVTPSTTSRMLRGARPTSSMSPGCSEVTSSTALGRRSTTPTLDGDPQPVEVIPTGSLMLDRALGVGGIPRGPITEIYGPNGGGKTTLAQHVAAEAQKLGDRVVYIDMEHALDPAYLQACGVDIHHMYLSQPDTGTAAFDIIKALVSSQDPPGLIVVASVAAMSAPVEREADAGDQFVGVQARMMSQNLKVLAPMVGLMGTFISGSNTVSNIMFGVFQLNTAEEIGLSPVPILALQAVGGAAGNMICIHNVVAVLTTVGLLGREGSVVRKNLPVAVLYALLAGALAWLITPLLGRSID